MRQREAVRKRARAAEREEAHKLEAFLRRRTTEDPANCATTGEDSQRSPVSQASAATVAGPAAARKGSRSVDGHDDAPVPLLSGGPFPLAQSQRSETAPEMVSSSRRHRRDEEEEDERDGRGRQRQASAAKLPRVHHVGDDDFDDDRDCASHSPNDGGSSRSPNASPKARRNRRAPERRSPLAERGDDAPKATTPRPTKAQRGPVWKQKPIAISAPYQQTSSVRETNDEKKARAAHGNNTNANNTNAQRRLRAKKAQPNAQAVSLPKITPRAAHSPKPVKSPPKPVIGARARAVLEEHDRHAAQLADNLDDNLAGGYGPRRGVPA